MRYEQHKHKCKRIGQLRAQQTKLREQQQQQQQKQKQKQKQEQEQEQAHNIFKPRFPVILIPGLVSSSLEVYSSELKPKWSRSTLWLDISKIGN